MTFSYSTDPVDIVDWQSLKLHDLCSVLPRIPEDELEKLRQSIIGNGLRFPIILFEGKILDGRHRFEICVKEGIEPRFETFMGPGSAMDYIIDVNVRRRHLNAAQRLDVLTELNRLAASRAKGREAQDAGRRRLRDIGLGDTGLGKFTQTSINTPNVVAFPSAEPFEVRNVLAKEAGVSPKTASDFVTIKEEGTQEDVEVVKAGDASISAKAKEVRERKKPKAEFITLDTWKGLSDKERSKALATVGEATFNKQDNESIGWAKWSWNPVTGCKHNCPYCYARDIAERFYEQGFVPSLMPARLTAPQNQRPPRGSSDPADNNVFTCSMADLFGKWVPEAWIEAVMASVERSPEWNFLFLTKFPLRMVNREVPKNAWLGTSVDMQARVSAVEEAFASVPAATKWLSIEPMIEPLTFKRPDLFKWVVIGGASRSSQTPAWRPPGEWVARLYLTFKEAGAAVYIKDNARTMEYPWQEEPQMAPKVLRYLKSK